jgi:hypothetical protein
MRKIVKILCCTMYCAVISTGFFYSDDIAQELTHHSAVISIYV